MTRMLWDDDSEDDITRNGGSSAQLPAAPTGTPSNKSANSNSTNSKSTRSKSTQVSKPKSSKATVKEVVACERIPDEPGTTSESPLSIDDLNRWIAAAIEANIPKVWVAGEVTDLSQPRSGHIYMGLKDSTAQIRAVLWRSSAERLKFHLEDGQAVLAYGRVDLYSPRGSYQLVIERIEPQGVGALQLAFQQLYQRLSKEGLFDAGRKKPLVAFPKRIGFVTSPSGAAIKDFLEVLRRRWRGTDVIVIPARVQGDGAAREIAAGIELAQQIVPPLDCLVIGRGGGSMEDLWCFNEEIVLRAIASCKIPTISAVGHEIDVTLSDLVADVRALTPSEAAELVVPSETDILAAIQGIEQRAELAMQKKLDLYRMALDAISRRPALSRPDEQISRRALRLDELSIRIERAIDRTIESRRLELGSSAAALDALSPLKTLERGYSLSRLVDAQTHKKKLLMSIDQIAIGDEIDTQLANGRVKSLVTRVIKSR